MKSERIPKIGDIYLMKFEGDDSEQNGWRPGLVFQNNTGNAYSPNIIAIPLTGAVKKVDQPTHVFLSAEETGLRKNSIALCENPECMSKSKVGRYLTTLSDEYMKKIAEASLLATSALAYLDLSVLMTVWKKASELNTISSRVRA